MKVADLPDGARFRACYNPCIEGTVEEVTPSGVRVRLNREKSRSFTTADGREVRISTSTERTTWAHGVEVERIR